MIGSVDGASGLNAYADRLNSISTDNSIVSGTSINIITPYQDANTWTGSMISGTSTNVITPYQNANIWAGSMVSGTQTTFTGSGLYIKNDATIGNKLYTKNINVSGVVNSSILDVEKIRGRGDDNNNLFLEGYSDGVVIGTGAHVGAYNDLYVEGDLDVDGAKNCSIKLDNGSELKFAAIESPSIWFEEKISSQLENGSKTIILESNFLDACSIDENNPLHVILSNTNNNTNIWVNKFTSGINVNGSGNTTFDASISAKRKGYEDIRFGY